MLKKIGVFSTPSSIEQFGDLRVFDLRKQGSTNALWALVENEAIAAFALLDTTEDPIGAYVAGGEWIKSYHPARLLGDIRMMSLWNNRDVSRTGLHGTQMYACLMTDLAGCPSTKLEVPVRGRHVGMVEMDWIRRPDPKYRIIPRPMAWDEKWCGVVGLRHSRAFSTGNPFNEREYQTFDAESWVDYGGREYEIAEYCDSAIVEKIREIVPPDARPPQLEEALLSFDYVTAKGTPETCRALIEFYRVHDKVETIELCADYGRRKAQELADIKAGFMLDLIADYCDKGNGPRRCDMWVVSADGALRQHDDLLPSEKIWEERKRWQRIEPSDLVIGWEWKRFPRGSISNFCEVVHYPVGGVGMVQCRAVEEIEAALQRFLKVEKGWNISVSVSRGGARATSENLEELRRKFGK